MKHDENTTTKDYIKELAYEITMRSGMDNESIRNTLLGEKLKSNLTDIDNAREEIKDLRSFNTYKNNVNKIMDELNKDKDFSKDGLETKEFLAKEFTKFRKDFERKREIKKDIDKKISTTYKDKISKLDERLQKIVNSNDKRVTRWQKNIEEKLENTIKEREAKFKSVDINFKNSVHQKFSDLKDTINHNLDNVYNFRLDSSNNLYHINMTTKNINPKDSKFIAEAFIKNIHQANIEDLQKDKLKIFDNKISTSIMIDYAKSKFNKAYEQEKFVQVPKKNVAKIKEDLFQMVNSSFKDLIKIDESFKKEIDKKINDLVKISILEFKNSKAPIIAYEKEREANRELRYENAKISKQHIFINDYVQKRDDIGDSDLSKEDKRLKYLALREDIDNNKNLTKTIHLQLLSLVDRKLALLDRDLKIQSAKEVKKEVVEDKVNPFSTNQNIMDKKEKTLKVKTNLKVNEIISNIEKLEDRALQTKEIDKLQKFVNSIKFEDIRKINDNKIQDLNTRLNKKDIDKGVEIASKDILEDILKEEVKSKDNSKEDNSKNNKEEEDGFDDFGR